MPPVGPFQLRMLCGSRIYLGVGDLQGTRGDGLGEDLALRCHHRHGLVQGSTCGRQGSWGCCMLRAARPQPPCWPYLARRAIQPRCPWPGCLGAVRLQAPRCPVGGWRRLVVPRVSSAASPAKKKKKKVRFQSILSHAIRALFSPPSVAAGNKIWKNKELCFAKLPLVSKQLHLFVQPLFSVSDKSTT